MLAQVELVVVITVALLAAVLSRRVRIRWPVTGALVLSSAGVALIGAERVFSEGDRLCLDCGRVRRGVELFGATLPFLSREVAERSAGATYEQSFPEAVPARHSHRWLTVGCHRFGALLVRGVWCTRLGPVMWFRDLPKLSDRRLATSTAGWFAKLDQDSRIEVLDGYGPALSPDDTAEARFASWQERWKRNPAALR